MRKLLIEAELFEIRIALIDNDKLVELYVFDPSQIHSANCLDAVIISDCPELGAYFVDIGLPRAGFLRKKDIKERHGLAKHLAIGTKIKVQIIRHESQSKGARVTPLDNDDSMLSPYIKIVQELGPDEIILGGSQSHILKPLLSPTPIIHHKPQNLFLSFGLEEEFDNSLQRRLSLSSGGSITIDENEAMCVIDVDGGASLALVANNNAAVTIAREIRRRNIGGQIAIDFIKQSKSQQYKTQQILLSSLQSDPQRPQLLSGNLTGIMVIIRPRIGISLYQSVMTVCPFSDGHWPAARHLMAKIMRLVNNSATQFLYSSSPRDIIAKIPRDVMEWAATTPQFPAFQEWVAVNQLRLEIMEAILDRKVTLEYGN